MRARGRIGSTLRRKWRLDSLLGVGGMAAVYAGTHRNGSRAAVKVLHAELTINAEVRSRFLREGYVANSIGHEGAVKVLDDDTAEDGSLFLVTELLDGETLEDRRLRLGGRLPEDDVLSITDQLLDVLIAAHERGVVHRDLKPDNLFLSRAGQLKVLDFGIAALRSLSTASTATKQGTSMGTAAFMSPEQARGLWTEVDAQSDLWACGATMFCLLSGTLVHDGRTTNEVLLNAMTLTARPIASVVPETSPAVALVVDRALAFDREKRWRNARRMQDAVRRAYHDRSGSPITTAPKLVVPETVPNRTLPGADTSDGVARLPTTARPVASPASTGPAGRKRKMLAVRVLGVAVTAGASVALLAAAGHRTSSGSPTATSTTPAVVVVPREESSPKAASAAPTVLPVAAPIASAASVPVADVPGIPSVPEWTVTDLPTASPTLVGLAPAKPSAAVAPSAPDLPTAMPTLVGLAPAKPPAGPAPSASVSAKPQCEPPYVVDAKTGHMRWKVECFER